MNQSVIEADGSVENLRGLVVAFPCEQQRIGSFGGLAVKYVELSSVESDQISLKLFPSQENPYALVVWIHGGGWVKGDRRNVLEMPRFFKDNNVLFISANYPLRPSTDTSLIDLQLQALRGLNKWLIDNPYRQTYSPAFNNISILSHSAGSHLVTLADKRFGWNASVRNLILMDSGAYDLRARFKRGRPLQRKMFEYLIRLDLYPASEYDDILRSYSPALLPSKPREGHPLNVTIISSERPGARYSAERLKSSYGVTGYTCRTYFWDWEHDDFPDAVGVDHSLSDLILNTCVSAQL